MKFLQHLIFATLSIGLVIIGIACADDKPPVISEISVSDLTATTATINWVTNERATSQVSYGLDVSYSIPLTGDSALTTTHSVTLSSLNTGATYHYRVESSDASGNQSTSGDQTFDTPWVGPNGETINENVTFDGAIIVGADGQDIALTNNPKAHNPTWAGLEQFLRSDRTNTIQYSDNTFVCADFAETLHNNAEKLGIRAAYVSINLGPQIFYKCGYVWNLGGGLHACNAFMTTDRGLVFIDDTGNETGTGEDCTVSVVERQTYTPTSMFSNTEWCPVGTVENFAIQW